METLLKLWPAIAECFCLKPGQIKQNTFFLIKKTFNGNVKSVCIQGVHGMIGCLPVCITDDYLSVLFLLITLQNIFFSARFGSFLTGNMVNIILVFSDISVCFPFCISSWNKYKHFYVNGIHSSWLLSLPSSPIPEDFSSFLLNTHHF